MGTCVPEARWSRIHSSSSRSSPCRRRCRRHGRRAHERRDAADRLLRQRRAEDPFRAGARERRGARSLRADRAGRGSDAGSIRTAAVPDDGGWTITGSKQWITNGSHAGTFVLFARSDPSTAGPRGVSCFLLDGDQVTVVREEEKLGLNSSSTADIRVDGVHVGLDRLLHEERKGFTVAMATLDGGRIGIAAQAVGIAQAAYDTARAYAAQRRQFGHRIAEFQAIQFALAEMATSIDAARLAHLSRGVAQAVGPAAHRRGSEGEAVRVAGCRRGDGQRDQVLGRYGYTKGSRSSGTTATRR